MPATRRNWPSEACPPHSSTQRLRPNHRTRFTCRHISSSDLGFGMKTFTPTLMPSQQRKTESTVILEENLTSYMRWIFWHTHICKAAGRQRSHQLSKRSETCLPERTTMAPLAFLS